MADPGIAYGASNAPGLPPVSLPMLGDQQPLRIEVTKTGQAPAADWTPQPWVSPGSSAASAAAPGAIPTAPDWTPQSWTTPEEKKAPREVGGGEATLRGLGAGLSLEFEPAIAGSVSAAKTAIGMGEPGKTAGQAYNEARQAELESNQQAAEQHPYLYHGGEIGGVLATAAVPGLGAARGATFAGRVLQAARAGGVSGTLTGAGSATSEGQSPTDVAIEAAKGGAVGTALGGAGGAVLETVGGLGRGVVNAVRGHTNTDTEAARRILAAHNADVAEAVRAGEPASPFTPLQRQQMAEAGTPQGIVDAGGERTMALARSAANTSPRARRALTSLADRRFTQQADRVSGVVGGLTAGPLDNEALQAAARHLNGAAYRRAEVEAERRFPNGINSPELERLSSRDAVLAAMHRAASSARDEEIATGGRGGFNAGVSTSNGVLRFQNRRGVAGYPGLTFWDYTQRELRGMIDEAQRAGNSTVARRLMALRRQLVNELDAAVPEFGAARGTARAFKGAEDAYEAGRNYVSMGREDMRAALRQMSAAEHELFARGFTQELIEKIDSVRDRVNVINQAFLSSRDAREKMQLALGPERAAELESFLRSEDIVDRLRQALGNSTTARQLHEIGAAGGASAVIDQALGGGFSISRIISAAFGAAILRQGGQMIDQRVATRVGEMLASGNPQLLAQGAQLVAGRPRLMNAMRLISNVGTRELIAAAGAPNLMAAGMTLGAHLRPAPAEPEQGQGRYDDQYDSQGTGHTP